MGSPGKMERGRNMSNPLKKNGGRSRTRTYDLSHVRLSTITKFRQTCLENTTQTTSGTVDSLPGFANLRLPCTHKKRYSRKLSKASRHRESTIEKGDLD